MVQWNIKWLLKIMFWKVCICLYLNKSYNEFIKTLTIFHFDDRTGVFPIVHTYVYSFKFFTNSM